MATNLTSAEICEISFFMLVKYSVAIVMTVMEKAIRKAHEIVLGGEEVAGRKHAIAQFIYSCKFTRR